MNKTIGIGIGVIALGVAVVGISNSMDSKSDMMQKDVAVDAMMDEKGEMGSDMMGEDSGMMGEDSMKKDAMMDDSMDAEMMGSYEAYAPEKIARAETGDVVLFFHASWCPSCRGLNADIEKNVSMIPGDVTILKVDYDKETELKKKYGVTYQHTLVQVDKDGNLITKWSGGANIDAVLAQVK